MVIIFEFFISIFGEIVLQIVAEILMEFGLNSLAEVIKPKRERKPVFAFFGYAILGGIVGAISLAFFPDLLLDNKAHAIGNMIITPLIAGLSMSVYGKFKHKRGKEIIKLDSFSYGYIFALTMAVIRYAFG